MAMTACYAVTLCSNHASYARDGLVCQGCISEHAPGVNDAVEDAAAAEGVIDVLLQIMSNKYLMIMREIK